ncbi:MAG: hypothetical protein P8N02_05485 [Actinomycetota bacterium]|nr:hypothetical protein [Actinomycetota bacterium]
MFEVNEAAQVIHDVAHPDANIIFGAVIDDTLGEEIRVTVIAAGFDRWDESADKGTRTSSSSGSTGSTGSDSGRGDGIVDVFATDEMATIDDEGDDDFDVPSFLK